MALFRPRGQILLLSYLLCIKLIIHDIMVISVIELIVIYKADYSSHNGYY